MTNFTKVAIIGGGPAGLFCAYELLRNKSIEVHLFERTGGVGKNHLVAGNSGLNLTHSEELSHFSKRYGKNKAIFKELISDFSAQDLTTWAKELGTETFTGSSGRIFPKKMKAADILHQWMRVLKDNPNFHLHLKHSLVDIQNDGDLLVRNDNSTSAIEADFFVMALGGGSWAKTGSDGKWMNYIEALNVETQDLAPMNCGFEITWSDHFLEKIERGFIKNITVSSRCGNSSRGEIMLTPYGVEGGAIYAISNYLRDDIVENKVGKLYIDFKPDLSVLEVKQKVSGKSKDSLSNKLRKGLGRGKVERALLYEELDRDLAQKDSDYLAAQIKNYELKLNRTRPIDEAISTSGGVSFSSLEKDLSIKNKDNYYFIGEMLDFEAPTGGYLLQGCFSSAYRVAKSIKEKLSV